MRHKPEAQAKEWRLPSLAPQACVARQSLHEPAALPFGASTVSPPARVRARGDYQRTRSTGSSIRSGGAVEVDPHLVELRRRFKLDADCQQIKARLVGPELHAAVVGGRGRRVPQE